MSGIGQKHDWRLESFDAVKVHDPHHVLTPGFKGQRLDIGRERSVLVNRLRGISQTSSELSHLADAIDRLQQVASRGSRGGCCGKRQQAGVIQDLIDSSGRWQRSGEAIQSLEELQRRSHPIELRGGSWLDCPVRRRR